jgi:hypothetical protein
VGVGGGSLSVNVYGVKVLSGDCDVELALLCFAMRLGLFGLCFFSPISLGGWDSFAQPRMKQGGLLLSRRLPPLRASKGDKGASPSEGPSQLNLVPFCLAYVVLRSPPRSDPGHDPPAPESEAGKSINQSINHGSGHQETEWTNTLSVQIDLISGKTHHHTPPPQANHTVASVQGNITLDAATTHTPPMHTSTCILPGHVKCYDSCCCWR